MITTQTELTIGGAGIARPPKSYTVAEYRAQYIRERAPRHRITITNKKNVHEFIQNLPAMYAPIEHIVIIALNNANAILGYTIHAGTVNQSVLYPQEVFRFLLSSFASCFIMAHNHPAGSRTPSKADWQITKRCKDIGKNLDVHLLDHLIVADENIISLRDNPQW